MPIDQQDLVYGKMPDHSPANPETNITDYCFTDSSSIDTVECESGCAPQHCPAMSNIREEQLNIIEENQHANDMSKVDLVPRKYLEKPGRMQTLSKESTHQQNGEVIIWETAVPKHLAGALNGKEGRYLKFVKRRCGGMVYISTHPHTQDYMICNIMGTKNQVNKALELIRAKVKYHDLKNIYSPPLVTFGPPLSEAQTPKTGHHGHILSWVKPVPLIGFFVLGTKTG
ncbi:hypothetical protein AAFF_G00029070 [Aldrovandia affinis]|uniref:K Homology domain-containing protein n=1 Tax=Aldrovandia affinis TaxID=143900 RepID=A0AAD7WGF1_9TELE|nr:hypothetical protein AAFF_G00029070 [Aldrovandia affinis]